MSSREFFYNRLDFFERAAISRANTKFQKLTETGSQNISEFFISALSEAEKIDYASIKNILNFAQTYFAIGTFPSQSVLNIIVKIIFQFPVFTPQLTTLLRYLTDDGWLYNSLVHCLVHSPQIVLDSIERDDPIWFVFIEIFKKDFDSKKSELSQKGSTFVNRNIPFIIDVFVLYYPDESEKIHIIDLAKKFVEFCANTRNQTSLALLSLVIQLFPDDFLAKDYENLIPVGLKYFIGDPSEILKHLDPETNKFIVP